MFCKESLNKIQLYLIEHFPWIYNLFIFKFANRLD
jgi:hypothetical protein